MAKAKSNVSTVIDRLQNKDSSYMSFSTPNGLTMSALIKDGKVDANEDLIVNGQRINAAHFMQAAEILRIATENASKVCVFHGFLRGDRFGCDMCRKEMSTAINAARSLGTHVVEEDEG